MLVSHVSSTERNCVDPERVESVESGGNARALSQSAGDTLVAGTSGTSQSIGAWKKPSGKWLIDKVGDYGGLVSDAAGNASVYSQTT